LESLLFDKFSLPPNLAGRLAGVEALAVFSPTAGGPLAFALK
jgi:hypothetical protein